MCWKVSERLTLPGVAVGLAWTPVGGEIMFVEASRTEGEGQLTLTGQLGDVMKESAHLAISWLRANAKKYQLTNSECTHTLTTQTQTWISVESKQVFGLSKSLALTVHLCVDVCEQWSGVQTRWKGPTSTSTSPLELSPRMAPLLVLP